MAWFPLDILLDHGTARSWSSEHQSEGLWRPDWGLNGLGEGQVTEFLQVYHLLFSLPQRPAQQLGMTRCSEVLGMWSPHPALLPDSSILYLSWSDELVLVLPVASKPSPRELPQELTWWKNKWSTHLGSVQDDVHWFHYFSFFLGIIIFTSYPPLWNNAFLFSLQVIFWNLTMTPLHFQIQMSFIKCLLCSRGIRCF